MRVDATIWTNPKFVRFSRALERLQATAKLSALEYLVKIWGYCETGQRGEFWPGAGPELVEAICDWQGEPGALAEALETCGIGRGPGFLIINQAGVTVHEWNTWNSRAVSNWKLGNREKKARRSKPDEVDQNPPGEEALAKPRLSQGSALDAGEGVRMSERMSERMNDSTPQGARGGEEVHSTEFHDHDPEHVAPRSVIRFLPEVAPPTEAEVLAAADAYPGAAAQGVPARIPHPWVTRWWTNAAHRAMRHPDGWRSRLYAEFTADAHARRPGTSHQAPAAAAPGRPSATPPTTKTLRTVSA